MRLLLTMGLVGLLIALAFGSGILVGQGRVPDAAPAPPVVSTTDSEVSDLIARLWPLATNPDGEWFRSGLTITFYGKRSVKIDLKTPDGNEYHGQAANLQDAAKRITEPSTHIKDALEGWSK